MRLLERERIGGRDARALPLDRAHDEGGERQLAIFVTFASEATLEAVSGVEP